MDKIILILSLLLTSAFFSSAQKQAYAQTPFTPQMAQQYYQTCLQQKDERLTAETQDIFCKCTASQTTKMSVEEFQAMARQDQSGRDATNKMILNVYAPCMEFPVRNLVFGKCQQNAYQAGAQICGCLANNMATYVRERAVKDLPQILAQNPNVYDPMEAIVSSPSYENMEKRIALGCIQGEYQ